MEGAKAGVQGRRVRVSGANPRGYLVLSAASCGKRSAFARSLMLRFWDRKASEDRQKRAGLALCRAPRACA